MFNSPIGGAGGVPIAIAVGFLLAKVPTRRWTNGVGWVDKEAQGGLQLTIDREKCHNPPIGNHCRPLRKGLIDRRVAASLLGQGAANHRAGLWHFDLVDG